MARRNPADPFSLNIGRLCHEWEVLEWSVEILFALIAGIPSGPVRSMIHCLDVRDMMEAIKVGAVATATPDMQHWTEEVIGSMDYIDNTLRPRRNRFVHDGLWEGHWGIMRAVRQVKIHRPQARQPHVLKRSVRVESLKDLRATLKAVKNMSQHVMWLEYFHGYLLSNPDFPREPLSGIRPSPLPPLPNEPPRLTEHELLEFAVPSES